MSPAEEIGRAQDKSNAKRWDELWAQIIAAGCAKQVTELLKIQHSPCKAYSERLRNG